MGAQEGKEHLIRKVLSFSLRMAGKPCVRLSGYPFFARERDVGRIALVGSRKEPYADDTTRKRKPGVENSVSG
jgi:hypothetical protein